MIRDQTHAKIFFFEKGYFVRLAAFLFLCWPDEERKVAGLWKATGYVVNQTLWLDNKVWIVIYRQKLRLWKDKIKNKVEHFIVPTPAATAAKRWSMQQWPQMLLVLMMKKRIFTSSLQTQTFHACGTFDVVNPPMKTRQQFTELWSSNLFCVTLV